MLKVAIFDDVLAARGENFNIPGLQVDVHAHADEAVELCRTHGYDVVCMDFAMGVEHQNGATAIGELRADGFEGKIVAISSDPAANAEMKEAGANEALGRKVHLRSYLVRIGEDHLEAVDSSSDESTGKSTGTAGEES